MTAPRAVGARLRRREDKRFITGRGRYAADLRPDGLLHLAVVRSPYASAEVRHIETSAAASSPGVVEVFTEDDLGRVNDEFPVFQLKPHPGIEAPVNHRALATGRVSYVGEPVAAVVAHGADLAVDATSRLVIDYQPLHPVVTVGEAVAQGAVLVHDKAPGNIGGSFTQSIGDVDRAIGSAAHVFRRRLSIDRGAGQPIETRTIVAEPSPDGVTLWSGTQNPHRMRDFLADRLGLEPTQLRLVCPDTGGGFGVKAYNYPEDLLVTWTALRLGRPVRWEETRREHAVATFAERGQTFDATLALDDDLRITALDVAFDHDLGAYIPYGFVVAQNTANHLMGPYAIPAARIGWRGVYTNLPPTATYRGAGRPQAIFVIERLLDHAALGLGIDPAELRRRNLVPPDRQPYDTGMVTPVGPLVYDSGDYPAAMDEALGALPYDEWRSRQEDLRGKGRLIGIGVANYVEFSVTFPFEGAAVEFRDDGSVRVATGPSQQGQGYETVFAQVCADVLELPPETVEVVAGDTAAIENGVGNYGSRVAIMAGNAAHIATNRLREAALDVAAEHLGASPELLRWKGGAVVGGDGTRLGLGDLAALARTAGKPLEETVYYEAAGPPVANGVHAAVVEVDPENGEVSFHRYVVVHDCGTMINPTLVEGQIVGGLVQGLGGSLMERLVFDGDGQPLTTTFMDYLLPSAQAVPELELRHMVSPSPLNPLGVKGAGEGGIIPVYALVAAAVEDATGAPVDELPLSLEKVRLLAEKGLADR